MTAYEISRAIVNGTFTTAELDEIIQSVKFARTQLARKVTFELKHGDTVSFVGRGNRKVVGTVTDIKVKNVIVNTPTGNWRVPASMLTKV